MPQYPVLLPGTAVTLTSAGATQATFVALVVVAIAAVILVVPSFALLYSLQGRRLLSGDEQGLPATAASPYAERPSAPPGQPAANQHLAGAIRAAVLGVVGIAALSRRQRSR